MVPADQTGRPCSKEQAQQFIEALTGLPAHEAELTFQTFPDHAGAQGAPSIIHGTLESCWGRLTDLNEHGHGVFFMVNQGDGQGRRAENVVRVRALFVDDDADAVTGAMLSRLKPSIAVSSGRGFHYYWPVVESSLVLAAFTPAQEALALCLGTDPKVKDLPRVMRLPGTYHQKDPASPRLVELLWADRRRFQAGEVLKFYPAPAKAPVAPPARRLTSPAVGSGADASRRAEAYIANIVAVEGQGGHNETFKAAQVLVRDFGLDYDAAWDVLVRWNQTNARPPWDHKDLRRKLREACEKGRRPVGSKLETPALPPPASPLVDPASYCFDLTTSSWRRWTAGAWNDGLSESALNRLLKNTAGLDKDAIEAWKSRVPVVADARPVWSSRERLVEEGGELLANTYRPASLAPQAGDCEPVLRVIRNLAGGQPEVYGWFMGWLGRLMQNIYAGKPARIGTAPVFFGAKGAGKGVLEELLKAILGPWNVASIGQGDLGSDFNSFLDGKLLVFADETFTSDRTSASQSAKVKNLITAHTRLINKKGVAQYQREAVENWIFASNSHRPVEVERGDRRFTVIRTGGPIPVDLGAQVADDARAGGPLVRAFLAHLLALPAEALAANYRALHTSAKDDVLRASGTSADQFAHEVLARGFYSVANQDPVDLYLASPDGFRSAHGTPALTRAKLMEVYRAFCSETGASPEKDATLLASLKEAISSFREVDLNVAGRVVRCVAGMPRMLPESNPVRMGADEVAQRSLL